MITHPIRNATFESLYQPFVENTHRPINRSTSGRQSSEQVCSRSKRDAVNGFSLNGGYQNMFAGRCLH
jgi:hypothetical protein